MLHRGVEVGAGRGAGRDARVRELFERACGVSPAERTALLEGTRATEPDVVTEVEELLRFHDNDSKILDRPVVEAAAQVIGADVSPGVIGSYRVVRELGQGGMGVVYEAEQDFPHRRVALKVVRPELVTGSLIKRFTHEAEALALLRHPGIAQLYEAGFADGERRRRPFMAMELVEGKPLSTFARERAIPMRERLMLLAGVCDAVDHAHKRGVIHRDLKPGNILVTADGQPKVLDFGIARLTAADGAIATVATNIGQIIGTLGYMSPEQFSGDPQAIDARSDVYALGVMLYELLAGRPPIAVATMSLAAAASAVQRDEPALLGVVSPALRGDVESIAAKALEKNPSQRYQSAAELAADIRRYLANEPVLAHPQTAWYQARKFAQRNRPLVALGAAAVVALMSGVVGTAWQAVSATRARHRADVQAQISRQRADFLTGIIKAATPEVAGGREITVREMLEKASAQLRTSTDLDPLVRADTNLLLTEAYTSLGDGVKSEEHARAALELHRASLGAESAAAIRDERLLCAALNRTGRAEEAVLIAEALLPRARAALGESDAEVVSVMSVLAASYANVPSRVEDAARTYAEAWETSVRLFGANDPRTLSTRLGLAYAANAQNDFALAEQISKEVMDARAAIGGPEHHETLIAGHLWVSSLQSQSKWDVYDSEAPVLHERMKRVLGERHAATVSVAAAHADRLRTVGRFEEALPLSRVVVDVYTERVGAEAMFTVMHRYSFLQSLIGAGRLEEARAVLRAQQDIVDRKYAPDGYMAAITTVQQAWLATREGDGVTAERWASKLRGTKYEPLLKSVVEPVRVDHSGEVPPSK
ncbi:MAG TPA: protein kinase [Phycisphaerales bacterium]|nr:protein kinase [Phycisphaerales bacterium]